MLNSKQRLRIVPPENYEIVGDDRDEVENDDVLLENFF